MLVERGSIFMSIPPQKYNLRYFESAITHEITLLLGEKISILKGGRGNICFRPKYRPVQFICIQIILGSQYQFTRKNLFKAQEKQKKDVKRYPERAKPMDRSLWTVLPFSMHKYEALHSGIVSLKLKNPNLQANKKKRKQ
jgi:hypothetical protein